MDTARREVTDEMKRDAWYYTHTIAPRCRVVRDLWDEVFNYALFEMWKAIPNYKPAGSTGTLRGFLRMVCKRSVVHYCRRMWRQYRRGRDERPLSVVPHPYYTTPELVELPPALVAALNLLPDKQRVAIDLFYAQGLSRKVCAASMGLANSTFDHHIAHALKALRGTIQLPPQQATRPTKRRYLQNRAVAPAKTDGVGE